MSQLCKEKITCPKCQAEDYFDFWTSINVDLNPELKEKIFNEEIFIWTCPKCGAKVFIPFGTLYHDMSHKFMLFFQHEDPEDGKKYESFDMPGAIGLDKDYIFRSVYGLMNFKEKIMVLENGLNDVAVEKLKYAITHLMDSSMSERGDKLFFEGITKPDDENKYGQIIFYRLSTNEDECGQIGLGMEKYYEQCLALKLDKRFEVNNCACVDEEWVSIKMKGLE